uniref:Uncharacterized protein n=1 Tax=Pygocentrus nattereri TaxID=42514 RepID=A0AAR2IU93_PYGNA
MGHCLLCIFQTVPSVIKTKANSPFSSVLERFSHIVSFEYAKTSLHLKIYLQKARLPLISFKSPIRRFRNGGRKHIDLKSPSPSLTQSSFQSLQTVLFLVFYNLFEIKCYYYFFLRSI